MRRTVQALRVDAAERNDSEVNIIKILNVHTFKKKCY